MNTINTYYHTIEQRYVDFTSRASLAAIINICLETAGLDANAMSFGVKNIENDNHTWVLSRFAIQIYRQPEQGEVIGVTTWISDINRLFSIRNFILRTTEGELIAEAVSQWCVLDKTSRKAVDLSAMASTCSSFTVQAEGLSITPPKKINTFTPAFTRDHKAVYTDLDFNKHVNAIRYIELMLNMLPLSSHEREGALRLDLHFMHECYYGDTLKVCYTPTLTQSLLEIVNITEDKPTSAVRCVIENLV